MPSEARSNLLNIEEVDDEEDDDDDEATVVDLIAGALLREVLGAKKLDLVCPATMTSVCFSSSLSSSLHCGKSTPLTLAAWPT
jgi:hypothetical protein